jgi:hypothetical protein
MYLISFIKRFFSFTFYLKFVEIHELFPCKTAYKVKTKKKFQNFFKKFAFYGLDMELEPEPEPGQNRNRNRNRNK